MKKIILIAAIAVAGAAMAAGLGPQNYVQDGLVTHFDAFDNEGTGTHNPSATTWRDLKGSAYITLQTGASWTGRYFDSSAKQHTIKTMPGYDRTSVSIEVPINVISNGASGKYPRIFANSEYFGIYFSGTGTSPALYFNGQNPDSRPSFGGFRMGSIFAYGSSTSYGIGLAGEVKSQTSVPVKVSPTKPAADWTLSGYSGYLHAHYYGLRLYNRALTAPERYANAAVDGLRFFSFTYTGTGAAENWSDIAWTAPERATTTAPSTQTNAYAQLVNVTANVTAADNVGLAGLSLEDGAKLNLASDVDMAVKALYVEGVAVAHGIYTGTGSFGTQVSWLSGDGVLRVAGRLDRRVPYLVPTPAGDGWYEFGLASGYSNGVVCVVAERPYWDDYAFPAGAKLRLVGGILLETVPTGMFTEYDTSGLNLAYLHGDTAGDVVNNGRMHVTGDSDYLAPYQVFSGNVSGNGKLYLTNFGKQARFTGQFDMVCLQNEGMQNGCLVWIDTLHVGGKFTTLNFSNCDGQYAMTTSWSANGLFFGRNDSDATADNELKIDKLSGGGLSRVDPNGKRWRVGGHVVVWGGNTVHVGELTSALHVMARRKDQDCTVGWFGSSSCIEKGTGNIVIDKLTSGTLYPSTNVNVKVGTVVIGSTFDYTYQSNAVNRMTLDITNTCNASAIVTATDIGMLPARISGFTGTVTLTDTATKSWTMPIDFTHGTNYLYNTTGCIGSGTLGSAPASGTINATFPTTGDAPVHEGGSAEGRDGPLAQGARTRRQVHHPLMRRPASIEKMLKRKRRTVVWLSTCCMSAALVAGAPPQAWEVKDLNGAPGLFRDGAPVAPLFFWQWELQEPDVREMSRRGFDLFAMFGSFPHYKHPYWRADGSFDTAYYDAQFDAALRWNPSAQLLPRLFVTAPDWWSELNTNEQFVAEVPSGVKVSWEHLPRESLASVKAREEVAPYYRRLLRHLIGKYGRNLLGVHVTNGPWGEDFSWDAYFLQKFRPAAGDQSEPMRRAFVQYLRAKYGNDVSRLRAAFKDPAATFETVTVPTKAERLRVNADGWRDPAEGRKVVDYFECHNRVTVDMLDYWCSLVKEESGGKLATLVFYGYTQDERWPVECDHRAISELYLRPSVDMLSAPHTYHRRDLGGDGEMRQYLASAAPTCRTLNASSRVRTVVRTRRRSTTRSRSSTASSATPSRTAWGCGTWISRRIRSEISVSTTPVGGCASGRRSRSGTTARTSPRWRSSPAWRASTTSPTATFPATTT